MKLVKASSKEMVVSCNLSLSDKIGTMMYWAEMPMMPNTVVYLLYSTAPHLRCFRKNRKRLFHLPTLCTQRNKEKVTNEVDFWDHGSAFSYLRKISNSKARMRRMMKSLLWPSRFLSKVCHASRRLLTLNKLLTRLEGLREVWEGSWCTPIVGGNREEKRLRAHQKVGIKGTICWQRPTFDQGQAKFTLEPLPLS